MTKNLWIILGALVTIAIISLVVDKAGTPQTPDIVGSRVLSAEDVASVDDIRLQHGEQSLHLKMTESNMWIIQGDKPFPANPSRIIDLLDQLAEPTIQRLVASNESRWPNLELDQKREIHLKQGEKLIRSITLGMDRPGGGQYIALDDSERSYLIDKNIYLDHSDSHWELKNLLDVSRESIQEIIFNADDAEKVWALTRNSPAEPLQPSTLGENEKGIDQEIGAVQGVFSQMSFTARSAAEDMEEAFEEAMTLQLKTFDSSVYHLQLAAVGSDDDRHYYLRVSLKENEDTAESQIYNTYMVPWAFQIAAADAELMLRDASHYIEVSEAEPPSVEEEASDQQG